MLQDSSLSVPQIDELLKRVPFVSNDFPDLKEWKDLIEDVARGPKKQRKAEPFSWVSVQAPGTPSALEAIFNCTQFREEPCRACLYALSRIRISPVKFWEAFDAWKNHEVHPLVQVWMEEGRFEGRNFTRIPNEYRTMR